MKLYLFASFDEAEYVIDILNMKKISDKPFIVYKNNDSYLALTNIGLINAATCTTYMLTKYKNDIDLVINAGLAGCYNFKNDLNINDIIFVNDAYIGHNDATCFGYLNLQTPKMPQKYTCYKNNNILKNIKQKNIVSTNIFIDDFKKYESAICNVKDIDLFDMEAGAIAQVCYHFNIKCIIIKIISDILKVKNSKNQFEINLTNCSKKIAKFLKSLQGENYGM